MFVLASEGMPALTLGQRSFDDLGTPLHEATFCVLDLETTGGNRNDDMITEIGVVKVRGGECLGTFPSGSGGVAGELRYRFFIGGNG